MDFNYLLYGPDIQTLDDKIKNIIGEKKAFLNWPLAFEKLRFEDFVKFADNLTIDAKNKELLDIRGLFNKKTDQKFIIIKNIHALAHSSENPEQFYKNILGSCNFFTNQLNINFMLTCARIPRVFLKENPFVVQWKMLPCTPKLDEKDEKIIQTLQHQEIYGRQFTNEHYISLKEELKKIKVHELINIAKNPEHVGIHKQIIVRLESFMEFESDIYFRDTQSKDETLSIDDIDKIKEELEKHIFGQEEAIQRVVNVALMYYGSKKIDDKPRQIFLFVGPSGVGKTELCIQLKKRLPDYSFLQINLAEHQDEHAVNKLIGIGKGYIDSESGGILTEPVRRYPKHIILFDELDQAHKSIKQLFYKIFEGTIQDGRGRNVSFRDCFIFMTTNKGVIDYKVPTEEKRQEIELTLNKEKEGGDFFTPAFLGRINWIVQFNQLSPRNLVQIAEDYFTKRILDIYNKDYNVSITFNSLVKSKLIKQKVFDVRHLFYEIWAIMASKKGEQGARRLYQYMDELLIYPLEYFRLRNKKWFENGKSKIIELRFQPLLPDIISYDQADILLIDDDENEVKKLESILFGLPANIQYANFNEVEKTLKYASSFAAILLDLLNESGEHIGMDILEKMKDQNISSTVSIYTSMPEGSALDQLKGELWKYKIFQYVNKNREKRTGGDRESEEESKQRIKKKICTAIQAYYLDLKCKDETTKIASVKIKLPEVKDDDLVAIFGVEYKWQ